MAKYRLSHSLINHRRRAGKITDGAGLFFLRNRDGSLTAWQRHQGRDVKVAGPVLGEVTAHWLQDVRARAYGLRLQGPHAAPLVADGMSFEGLWTSYVGAVTRWSETTRTNYDQRMKTWIGDSDLWRLPVSHITPATVADAVAEARRERPLLAPRLLLDIRRAFSWLMVKGAISTNPAAIYMESLRAVEAKPKFDKYPFLRKLEDCRELLGHIETSNTFGPLRSALRLQAFTFQRTTSVGSARWEHIDLRKARWLIPRQSMKQKDEERGDHILPLHPVMADMLAKMPRKSAWVFPEPSNPDKHVPKEQFARALHRLGYRDRHVPHGWRSSFQSLAEDAHDRDGRPLFAPRWIQDALDHKVQGVDAHYARSKVYAGINTVVTWWGDQLAGGRP